MSARDRILARLRASAPANPMPTPAVADWFAERERQESPVERLARFRSTMEAGRTEIHTVSDINWAQKLYEVLAAKGCRNLLMAPGTAHGARALEALSSSEIACRAYDRPIDEWKPELFHDIDASLTGARGAIAETGSLILWPDVHEPRLMSLVPPIHVVLLDAATIHPTFYAAMQAENWAGGLPTNALLISSPSKTADIQQTLAYGAHGPKELIVLLKESAQ
jgi:L-lactate dehydrogenase complex protein LldG